MSIPRAGARHLERRRGRHAAGMEVDPEHLIAAADQALYQEKLGRNRASQLSGRPGAPVIAL